MDFHTADLCDTYQNETQVLGPGFHHFGGISKFHGFIKTVKIEDNNQSLIELLKEDGSGKVAVVDVDAKYVAVVGDKLMGIAKQSKWSGMIINGYIRDIVNTQSIDVGLMALGTCPKKAPEAKTGEKTLDLEFGGVTFIEGDYLYSDADGVVITKNKLH